ncbi:GTPase [Candidatus Thorarchaeota archaeon]|nr:MAG: GTPase [Candidatus Thorarchaeota archaeon]
MFVVFLVGTAGSGKSLLAAALERWLLDTEISTTVVNLDPGVDAPPYTSDVDIREYVDYGEVITTFGLGPNGALVASMDMAIGHLPDIRDEILERETDYVLVDCPGQMELFAYRSSGPLFVTGLAGTEPALSLYLLDSNIARTPEGYISSTLLGLSISIRFGLPQLNLLSKSDILEEEAIERVVTWSRSTFNLEDALDNSASGLIREYSQSILRMLEDLGGATALTPVSAKTRSGLETIYGHMQRIFMGGDNVYD